MKTLIIYGTRNGSVREVAGILKKKLNGEVVVVDSKETDIHDITEFDTVLIGSSIYFGQIQRKIKDFIYLHKPELLNKKIGFFILAGEKDATKLNDQLKNTISSDVYDVAKAVSVLGSEIKLKEYSWVVRLLLKYAKGVKDSYKDIDKDKINEFVEKFN